MRPPQLRQCCMYAALLLWATLLKRCLPGTCEGCQAQRCQLLHCSSCRCGHKYFVQTRNVAASVI